MNVQHVKRVHRSEWTAEESLSNKSETGNMAERADVVFFSPHSMFSCFGIVQVNRASTMTQTA